MTKFLMVTGAAMFLLGTSGYAATGTFSAQGPLVLAKAACIPGTPDGSVSPSGPCQGNNGGGNGGSDGTPGNSGNANGGKKCGPTGTAC